MSALGATRFEVRSHATQSDGLIVADVASLAVEPRVAIPVGLAALVAGMQHGRASLGEALRVLVASLATLALIYLWARPPGIVAIAWPAYITYPGNKGERSLAELVSKNAAPVAAELPRALARYFLRERAGWETPTWFRWEARSGGLCLAPVAFLGLIGMAVVVRRIRREWLWLLLVGAGFALPVLTHSSARRYLVVDAGWCALAAHGLRAALRSRPARAAPRTAGALTAGFVGTLGVWSFAVVVLSTFVSSPQLSKSLPTVGLIATSPRETARR